MSQSKNSNLGKSQISWLKVETKRESRPEVVNLTDHNPSLNHSTKLQRFYYVAFQMMGNNFTLTVFWSKRIEKCFDGSLKPTHRRYKWPGLRPVFWSLEFCILAFASFFFFFFKKIVFFCSKQPHLMWGLEPLVLKNHRGVYGWTVNLCRYNLSNATNWIPEPNSYCVPVLNQYVNAFLFAIKTSFFNQCACGSWYFWSQFWHFHTEFIFCMLGCILNQVGKSYWLFHRGRHTLKNVLCNCPHPSITQATWTFCYLVRNRDQKSLTEISFSLLSGTVWLFFILPKKLKSNSNLDSLLET